MSFLKFQTTWDAQAEPLDSAWVEDSTSSVHWVPQVSGCCRPRARTDLAVQRERCDAPRSCRGTWRPWRCSPPRRPWWPPRRRCGAGVGDHARSVARREPLRWQRHGMPRARHVSEFYSKNHDQRP